MKEFIKAILAIFVLGYLLIIANIGYSQVVPVDREDSMIVDMCKTLMRTTGTDSARINYLYQHFLYPYMAQYPSAEQEKAGMRVYYRLQRLCQEFNNILARSAGENDNWETVKDELAERKISNKECRQFFSHKNYFYFESDGGDVVNLEIKNGYWLDKFKDGSYSRLKVEKIDKCIFDIVYLESNNQSRMYFNKKDDRYRYHILEKRDGYYILAVETIGMIPARNSKKYLLFTLYYH